MIARTVWHHAKRFFGATKKQITEIGDLLDESFVINDVVGTFWPKSLS